MEAYSSAKDVHEVYENKALSDRDKKGQKLKLFLNQERQTINIEANDTPWIAALPSCDSNEQETGQIRTNQNSHVYYDCSPDSQAEFLII